MLADAASDRDHDDSDTIVIDPDEHHSVLDDHADDHLDLSGSDDSIDAHMLELGKRRLEAHLLDVALFHCSILGPSEPQNQRPINA